MRRALAEARWLTALMHESAPQPDPKKSDGSTHAGAAFASFAASDMSRAQRLAQRIADDRAEAEVDALFGKVMEAVDPGVDPEEPECQCKLPLEVSAMIDEAVAQNRVPLASIRTP